MLVTSAVAIQGELNQERDRTRRLMSKLTKLETKYHMDREAQFGMSPDSPSETSSEPSLSAEVPTSALSRLTSSLGFGGTYSRSLSSE